MAEEAPPPAEITRMLQECQAGSREAFDRLIAIVYNELKTLASRQLAREWRQNRLETTAVVNVNRISAPVDNSPLRVPALPRSTRARTFCLRPIGLGGPIREIC